MFLSIFQLVGALFVAVSGINLYWSDTYDMGHEIEAAMPVSLERESWRDDANCKFKGIMVPFVRDWELHETNAESGEERVSEARPDRMAGVGVILNEKVCDGKSVPIMRAVDSYITHSQGLLHKGAGTVVSNLWQTPKQEQPRWLIQVLDRIEHLSPSNADAARFLEAYPVQLAQLRELVQGERSGSDTPALVYGEDQIEDKDSDDGTATQESPRNEAPVAGNETFLN